MNKSQVIKKTEEFVKSKLTGEGSGHDWWHVYRVWKNAIKIGKEEKVDLFVVELSALLHDIADFKSNHGDDSIGPKIAKDFLESLNVDKKTIDHIYNIIYESGSKTYRPEYKIKTKEGEVFQDADRLDAIGAIGIARCFSYVGNKGITIYDPDVKIKVNMSSKEAKKANSSAINHFYEKLLHIKDNMNTKTGRKIAEDRHKYMEDFLKRFLKEWNEQI